MSALGQYFLVVCVVGMAATWRPAKVFAADQPLRVESGLVSGLRVGEGEKIRVYKGIPYAAPPVGKLRWQPPQPPVSWQEVRECREFSAICPQAPYPPGSVYVQPPQRQSEDCLYLNVWTGATGPDERRPVMVWIHGGALTRGSASISPYDGEHLAAKGVILVTLNYRLGPFGYFAHPALSSESPHGSSGNYGVLDQIAALQWIKRNIAGFGGDPDRVTIFGESAGSWSVCALLATPLAEGLFSRAIGESGGCFSPMPYLNQSRHGLPSAEKAGENLAMALGCDHQTDILASLRAKSADELVAVAFKDPSQARARANVDRWVFPDEIYNIYAAGRQHKVPVLVGSNADEGTALANPALIPKSTQVFVESVRRKYKDLADRFLQVYPVASDSDVKGAFLHALRDETFTWEMRTWARMMHQAHGKAYIYYFSHVPPRPNADRYGAYHAAEIVYVFNNLDRIPWAYQPADRSLAEIMSDYWVHFATAGNPNGGSLAGWPEYDPQQERYLEFGDATVEHRQLLRPECDFYDAYFASQRAEATN